jgi:VWFA-related protein
MEMLTSMREARLSIHARFWLPWAIILCSIAITARGQTAAQQAGEPRNTAPSLQLNVNKVLVPVVVRDKQGRAVGDLKEEDFQVFDNDKPRPISAFTVERRGGAETNSETNSTSNPPGPPEQPLPPAGTQQTTTLPKRIIVFLFDDMHLNTADLVYAKKAAASALDGALDDSGMAAVVTVSGKTNSGITRDRTILLNAISAIQSRSLYRSDAAECPKIDYYQADLIENKHDSAALGDAVRQVFDCSPGLDVKLDYNTAQNTAESAARRMLNLGNQDVRATCANIAEFVRRMAPMPGQRTLILVSPGFLSVEQEAMAAEQQIVELAAQSNVTISAIDARGLYTTDLKASDHSPSFSTINGGGGSVQQQSDYRRSSMTLAEGVMAELAEGTGGTFFHNSNDLEAGFKSLTAAPEIVYLLELSLDNIKPDGSYHHLKVKVTRDGLQIQARRGYFVPKPEKNKK